MDVKKIKEEKESLQVEICVEVSRLISEFTVKTGIYPRDISIYMQELKEVGVEREFVISGCKVSLDI